MSGFSVSRRAWLAAGCAALTVPALTIGQEVWGKDVLEDEQNPGERANTAVVHVCPQTLKAGDRLTLGPGDQAKVVNIDGPTVLVWVD